MIRFFHDNKNSVVGIFGVSVIAFLMAGFGLGSLGGNSESRAAIRVDDVEVSYSDFSRELRETERRYRQLFGDNFDRFAASMNLPQQVVDRMISGILLQRFAERMDFTIGTRQVQEKILDLFGGQFDANNYRSYLQTVGYTSAQFEDRLREDLLGEQLTNLLEDVSFATDTEVKLAVEREETVYDVKYAELNPVVYEKDVEDPPLTQLEEFYQTTAADYETPEKISYSFLVFEPKDFLDLVEVSEDDIEFYYTEHQSEFQDPERIKARHIQLTFPEGDKDGKKRVATKEKAEELLEKIKAGADFSNLVKEFSDDLATRDSGGDLGWFQRGKMSPEFEKAVFEMKEGAEAQIVPTDYGYHIVQVEGFQPAHPRPLEDVKEEIEKKLRQDNAPAYTSAKAYDIFDLWQESKLDLPEYAAQNSMVARSSEGALSKTQDPSGLPGLTKQVFSNYPEEQQLIELRDQTVLVKVQKHLEPEIPSIDLVHDKLLAAWKKEQARVLAREKAEGLRDVLAKGTSDSFDQAAKSIGVEVKEIKGASRKKNLQGPLQNSEVQETVFSTSVAGEKPQRVFSHNGKYYLIEVAAITPPSQEVIKEKLEQMRAQEQGRIAQETVAALVNHLKAQADIEVRDDVLVLGG
ncbi:MAG: peptidylprolyl isomerase [Bdellovibrionales bacterium]|nr:peptidylprolyl isomerase [Bdellovibrionales bacterium]